MENINNKTFYRFSFIDFLRVIATLWLIPFHVARIFDIWEPNYIKSEILSTSLTVFIGLTGSWHMPLFFFLSGASSWLALNFRTGKQYIKERILRLLFPLIIGVVLFIPIEPYYALLDKGSASGTYLDFLSNYFSFNSQDLTGYFGTFTPSHLWFILYLFVFSIIYLPLFIGLKMEKGKLIILKLGDFFSRPGGIYFMVVPLVLTELLPDFDGKNPFTFSIYFIFGFIFLSYEPFLKIFDDYKKKALIVGIIALICVNFVWFSNIELEGITLISVLFAILRHFTGWTLIIAIIGYGRKYLNKNSKWLPYASEITYPFYIFHQIVIVVLGYYIIRIVPFVWLSFIIICIGSTIITILLCELFKLNSFTRQIVGMKPKLKHIVIINKHN